MSRMLDALRQVETRTPPEPQRHTSQEEAAPPADRTDSTEPSLAEQTAERVAQLLAAIERPAPLEPPYAEPLSVEVVPAEPQVFAPPPVAATERDNPDLRPAEFDPQAGGDWLASIAGADLRPGSRLGGQYRRLRDRILSQLPRGQAVSLVMAGAERNAGTTSTVVHLACVFAEVTTGATLVVDADVRRPQVATRLDIDAEFSLADVLLKRATWQQAVVRVPPGRVHVLAGSTERYEVDAGSSISTLLSELQHQYQVVLIDGGSAEASSLPLLAAATRGTYLLLDLASTPPHVAARAVQRVRAAGGEVLGCVLTGGGTPR